MDLKSKYLLRLQRCIETNEPFVFANSKIFMVCNSSKRGLRHIYNNRLSSFQNNRYRTLRFIFGGLEELEDKKDWFNEYLIKEQGGMYVLCFSSMNFVFRRDGKKRYELITFYPTCYQHLIESDKYLDFNNYYIKRCEEQSK